VLVEQAEIELGIRVATLGGGQEPLEDFVSLAGVVLAIHPYPLRPSAPFNKAGLENHPPLLKF
jgi:hypothetical protein